MSSVIQNGPSCQDSPAQECFHPNGKFGRNHRFFLHNNKLVDKPILLFPQGMVALVRALPQAYEIYDQQVIQMAETAGQAVSEVIYSIIIASSKVVQVKLEVSD